MPCSCFKSFNIIKIFNKNLIYYNYFARMPCVFAAYNRLTKIKNARRFLYSNGSAAVFYANLA